MIIDDSSLKNIDRMHYFRSYLTGEATFLTTSQLITGLTGTGLTGLTEITGSLLHGICLLTDTRINTV